MRRSARDKPPIWRILVLLRKQIFAALGILLLFRVLANIPISLTSIDHKALFDLFYTNTNQNLGQVLGLLNTFTGGSLQAFSLTTLGLYPYVIARLVLQFLRPSASEFTIRIVTVPVALLEALIICTIFHRIGILQHFSLIDPQYLLQSISTLMTLTAGTMVLLGFIFLLDEIGMGNGFSLIIFAGIVGRLPQAIWLSLRETLAKGTIYIFGILAFSAIVFFATLFFVFFVQGQRRVTVRIPRPETPVRRGLLVGNPIVNYIPISVMNTTMLSFISIQSVLLFLILALQFLTLSSVKQLAGIAIWISKYLVNTNVIWCYLLFFALAAVLTYTVTSNMAEDISERLQRQGEFIPGYRPGEVTENYLASIYNRFGVLNALLIGGVTIVSFVIRPGAYEVFSIASLLLVIITVIEIARWFEARSVMLNYSGFLP